MSIEGFKRNFKPLEILTEGQVEAIHRGTLGVLAETGIDSMMIRLLNFLRRMDVK